MSLARLVITAVTIEKRPKSEVARDYEVSRRWVQKLVARYEEEGEAAFEPRSRRPRFSPRQLDEQLEGEIVTLRKSLADQGLDAGAATIAYHLAKARGTSPSPATIWRVLSRRGFVRPEPHKAPKSSYVRFAADLPNERWQADVTHVPLKSGALVEVLNQLDDHSRYLVGSDAAVAFNALSVVESFEKAGETYGFPAKYLTDNAAVFTGAYRGRGWVALERLCISMGIGLRHSKPYHPQTCGKVERFHQTLKKWLANQEPPRSIAELQAQLDTFREYYNDVRPHRGIGRRTPAEAFSARPKDGPRGEPTSLGHYRVRRDVIDEGGTVSLRYNSRLYHVGLGRKLAGTRVLVLVHERSIRVITDEGELIRELTLDPSRDYQRQG